MENLKSFKSLEDFLYDRNFESKDVNISEIDKRLRVGSDYAYVKDDRRGLSFYCNLDMTYWIEDRDVILIVGSEQKAMFAVYDEIHDEISVLKEGADPSPVRFYRRRLNALYAWCKIELVDYDENKIGVLEDSFEDFRFLYYPIQMNFKLKTAYNTRDLEDEDTLSEVYEREEELMRDGKL